MTELPDDRATLDPVAGPLPDDEREDGDRTATSGARLMLALRLFTEQQPIWTVEAAAAALGISLSSAYRYFRTLVQFGFLDSVEANGCYVLGPAVIEFDRVVRVSDPLLGAAVPTMRWLAGQVGQSGAVLLCRLYQDKVMCIHEERAGDAAIALSYERGLPMPMFRGAASKAILASLAPRQMRRIFDRFAPAIAEAGLGGDWPSFREGLAPIRKQGYCVVQGELDPGVTGISAPLFSARGQVLGSLSIARHGALDEVALARTTGLLIAAAREIDTAAGNAVRHAGERTAARAATIP